MTAQTLYFILPLILILTLFSIEKSRDLLKNNKPEILVFVSGYLFLLADIKNDGKDIITLNIAWEDINPILLGIGILTSISSIILSSNQKTALKNKDFPIQKKEYYKLCSDFLRISFSKFFSNSSNNGRVSMYLHQNNSFILFGRYSNNPNYNKMGRGTYPDNEGLISKGWDDEVCVLHGVPEWRGAGQQYYNKVNKIKEINKDIVSGINMKSRSFYVKRVDNEDSRTPYGIIVIEQMKSNMIETDIIEDIFEKDLDNLILLFRSMKSLK